MNETPTIKTARSFGVFTVNATKNDDDDSTHHEVELVSTASHRDPLQELYTSHSAMESTALTTDSNSGPTTSPSKQSRAMTNGEITIREQMITEVDVDDQEARSPLVKFLGLRRRKAVKPNTPMASWTGPADDGSPPLPPVDKQFRIRSRVVTTPTRRKLAWWREHIASIISSYLAWSYRSSFSAVIVSSYLWYIALSLFYAILIHAGVRHQPHCISSVQYRFMDAFHLSWTTLATVGYGALSPTVATTQQRCLGINALMAFEAFVGVLFSGVSAAILIGKIARIQSIAQVRFSNPLCIRYGMAVLEPVDEDDDQRGQFPCPILEFRIINLLSGERGGAILNASVAIVASVTENDDESDKWRKSLQVRQSKRKTLPKVVQAAKTTTRTVGTVGSMAVSAGTKVAKQTGTALYVAGRRASQTTGSLMQQLNRQLQWTPKDDLDEIVDGDLRYGESEGSQNDVAMEQLVQELEARLLSERGVRGPVDDLPGYEGPKRFVAVDEGNAELAPPRVYHRLEIEVDKHPYFKRVWNVRHILNQSSPLLSVQARQGIMENNGFWPEKLNNSDAIRANVRFNDCIVSFSGVANVSGSNVHAQKVYNYADMHVGYSFANMLTVKNGFVVVDSVLLHDIHEQIGGGAEPMKQDTATNDT